MSASPSTPDEGSRGRHRARNGARKKKGSARPRPGASILEPSPASTYGDTAVDDSVPVTPQELGNNGSTVPVGRRPKPINLTPLLRTDAPTNDTSTANAGTPASSQAAPGQSATPRRAGASAARRRREKRARMALAANRGPHPHGADPAATPSSRATSDSSSPESLPEDLRNLTVADRTNNGSPGFVVHGNESRANDPFVSPTHGGSTRNGENVAHVQEEPGSSKSTSEQSPSGKSTEDRVADHEGEARPGAKPVQLSPRPDRSGQPISAENAQAILPPSACVFVANLASTRTDEQLEQSVTEVFKAYGTVYVKIRRDGRGMPYAFCQYTNDDDARSAIVNGRRTLINCRPCRTEPARVNRSVYVSRVTGGPVSEDEARRELSPYGQITACWFSSDTEREMYQLPEGIWVKFAFFQDCRDAQSGFRDDNSYRVEQPPSPADQNRMPQGRVQPYRPPPMRRRFAGLQHVGAAPPPSGLQIVDRRSIFIGNLPETTTRDRIAEVFAHYGNVVAVDIVVRPSPTRNSYIMFAFVEFTHEDGANRAITRMNQQMFDGRIIRVEPRESGEAIHSRIYYAREPAHVPGYAQQTEDNIADLPRAGLQSDAGRAAIGNGTHQQYAQSGERVYMSQPDYTGAPHLPMHTTGTISGTPVPAYPAYPQAQQGAEPASGPSAAATQPGYTHPGYYVPDQGSSAPMSQASAQATNPHGYSLYAAYQQYAHPQYSQYWPVGYYHYPMHYAPTNGSQAPTAAPTTPSVPIPETQTFDGPSDAAPGQEGEASGPN